MDTIQRRKIFTVSSIYFVTNLLLLTNVGDRILFNNEQIQLRELPNILQDSY